MNRFIKYIIAVPFIALILGSCDLDKEPYNGITHGASWDTYKDAVSFKNGLYAAFRTVQGGRYIYSEYQADLLNATIGFGNNQGDLYTWDFTGGQYDTEAFWANNYVAINNANNIINNIDKITGGSDEETADLKNIKGEAYFFRAMCYHALALRFAKDYEPASATTDLGLPIVTVENDVEGRPERSSLADTYTFIKEDITKARGLLSATFKTPDRLSIEALDLFEARVDLYMHNYDAAITGAAKTISKFTLITAVEDLKDMWLNDVGSEIVFQPAQNVDERLNPLTFFLNYNTGSATFQPYYIPTQWVLDLYEQDKDIRFGASFLKSKVTSSSVTEDDVYVLNKYPGNPDLKKTTYEYYNEYKTFRAPEAYLIAAEAAYQSNKSADVVLGYINDLREKRGASTLIGLSGANLFTQLKNEWIREYVGEAMRLNDLKRWHDGFTRHGSQDKEIVLKGDLYNGKVVEANDKKFVWEIPNNDLTVNPNLKPNW